MSEGKEIESINTGLNLKISSNWCKECKNNLLKINDKEICLCCLILESQKLIMPSTTNDRRRDNQFWNWIDYKEGLEDKWRGSHW